MRGWTECEAGRSARLDGVRGWTEWPSHVLSPCGTLWHNFFFESASPVAIAARQLLTFAPPLSHIGYIRLEDLGVPTEQIHFERWW